MLSVQGVRRIYLLALLVIDLHLGDGDGAIGIFVTVDVSPPQGFIAICCTCGVGCLVTRHIALFMQPQAEYWESLLLKAAQRASNKQPVGDDGRRSVKEVWRLRQTLLT